MATRAAARHLRDLYAEFGDWYLAIAAYNCGPGNVTRAIERTGYADFWELYKRNSLPRETANYLPIILAMTIMAKNPAAYGIEDVIPELPVAYDSLELTAPTHLALIADAAGRHLNELRELNPAVLKLVAPAGYRMHVPKGSAPMVAAALDSVPESRRASWRVHRVGSDETLNYIARQYRTTERQILEANGGEDVEAEAGDLIVVPVAYPGATAVKAKPTAAAAKRTASSRKKPVAASARKPATSAKSKAPAKPAAKSAAKPPAKTAAKPRTSTASAKKPVSKPAARPQAKASGSKPPAKSPAAAKAARPQQASKPVAATASSRGA
jgi:membrane-bound lytic murein transglycosylase D